MIKVERVAVYGIDNALYGMRLPMQSNDKSDSFYNGYNFVIGTKDLELAQKLIKAGSDHRKFMRQIFVSMAITSPIYFWKELDQYRVGCTTNSESTMHRLAITPITRDCFSFDDQIDSLNTNGESYFSVGKMNDTIIEYCENLRLKYVKTKDKRCWRALIQLLPSSWNQTRMWSGNFETLLNIINARKNHKLSEWNDFIAAIKNLPYAQELLFFKGE